MEWKTLDALLDFHNVDQAKEAIWINLINHMNISGAQLVAELSTRLEKLQKEEK